jgi:hypothetical protein
MTPNPHAIPAEQAKEIRRLSHDLSNALEIIVQANYLLGAMSHDESAKQWIQLLDNGVVQAAEINRSLARIYRRQQLREKTAGHRLEGPALIFSFAREIP